MVAAREPAPDPSVRADRLAGVLVGAAVGDAIGLPREGLSARRARRMFGDPPLGHALVLGRGLVSDDTEHAAMTAQALLAAPDSPTEFARSLAWRLRFWLLGLPGGVGFGTLRAIVKLWLGWSPERSGVRSAGNGPAMRAPVLGACLAHAGDRLDGFVDASTRLTHRDPRAEEGARVIARAAALAARAEPGRLDPAGILRALVAELRGEALGRSLSTAGQMLERGEPPAAFADALGLGRGVSGYIDHTVPVSLYAWLSSPADFRAAVEAVVRLGGDTDTTGAIVGGLAGAHVGRRGIPDEWVRGLVEWPRSTLWLERLGARLAEAFPAGGQVGPRPGPLPLAWPALPVRNLAFLAIVLAHGFRRLFPPYDRG